ncbi:beta-ketoacyl synthase N-terminal-like domain-containing protein [Kitasatospora mediocidica]|uniref:beta-ketoacyl synthase N-terminal-like domain-containing protein n=1 Tax=Kitasatospora mediocidica TaxID=58352 RepID=UPI0005646642|nr:beta-ketoacyl synthase N-terminal-like domain-containing protein [Kitasatospora mediocidica]
MSTTAIRRDRPVITAWSAVSAFGIGRTAFADGVLAGRPTATVPEPDAFHPTDEPACLVPGFAVREVLGKAGTRTWDRSTGLAVTAVRELLDEAVADRCPVATGTGTALVLGTTVGSAQSSGEFSRASFEGQKPYDVPAQLMPNVLMNGPAAATAIRFDLKGPNTTVAGGRAAGLLALGYARRLLAAGRAERALVGAVEDYSSTRAWLEQSTRIPAADGEGGTPLGEGSAVLLLEPSATVPEGRRVLAELLSLEVRVDTEEDPAQALGSCVREALAQAGARPEEFWAAVVSGLPGASGRRGTAELVEIFGAAATGRVAPHELIGDTAAASAVFQVATVLALADQDPLAAGRLAAITSMDRDGVVACAVLRLRGGVR